MTTALFPRTFAHQELKSVMNEPLLDANEKRRKEANFKKSQSETESKKGIWGVNLEREWMMEKKPLSDVNVRSKYPGTEIRNPMRNMKEERAQLDVKKQVESLDAWSDLSDDDKQKLAESANLFVKNASYENGLNSIIINTKESLKEIYDKSKIDVKGFKGGRGHYAVHEAGTDIELVFRNSKLSLSKQQAEEVKGYLKSLTPEIINKLKAAVDERDEIKTANAADKDKIREGLINEEVGKLLGHDKERENLDVHIGYSRALYQKQHEHNIQWADVCSRQDPKLFKAAQAQQKIRCDEALKEYIEEKNKRKKESAVPSTEKVALGVSGKTQQELEKEALDDVLDEDIMAIHDPNGLPTFPDFKAALEVDKHKVPRELKDVEFRYAKPGKHYGANDIVKIKIGKDGEMSFTSNVQDKDAYGSQKLHDTMMFMAKTIMEDIRGKNLRNPDDPSEEKIVYHFTSKEYCKVAYRAALIAGFADGNIRFDDKNKGATLLDEERKKIREEVDAKYKRPIAKQEQLGIHQAIARLPALDVERLKNAVLNGDIKPEEANDAITQYEQQTTKILKDISSTGAQYKNYLDLERTRPLTEDEEADKLQVRENFNVAVNKLNDVIQSRDGENSVYYCPIAKGATYFTVGGLAHAANFAADKLEDISWSYSANKLRNASESLGGNSQDARDYFNPNRVTEHGKVSATQHMTVEEIDSVINSAAACNNVLQKNVSDAEAAVQAAPTAISRSL